MKVLIVDQGRERSSVAAARALAAAGWTVGAGSAEPNLAARSKSVTAWHEVPHTDDGDAQFVAGLDEVAVRNGYEAVFVGWERAVEAVSSHRDSLSFPVGYGPHPGVLLAMDKERLRAVAARSGLAVPRTWPATEESLGELAGAVVIKSAMQAEAPVVVRIFGSPAEAISHVRSITAAGGRAIAQEVLRGKLAAVSLVAGPDGIVTYAQQVAELTWPRPVGITARGVSVPIDATLRNRVEHLLAELQWQGLAHIQFLIPADGIPRLIDFNPRYYGSMALAIRAGANHPDAWARVATGRRAVASLGAAGVRYQWFSRDVRASLATGPRESVRCLTLSLGAAHSLWSPSEPQLVVRFLGEQTFRKLKRLLRGESAANRRDAEVEASAHLHGVGPTSEVRQALRSHRVPPAPVRATQRVLMKAGRLSYEDQWLKPLQAARRNALGIEADAAPRLLVRVDEFPYSSGYDDPRFGYEASRRFHAVMAETGVPHLMSVVSEWTHDYLNPEGAGGRPLDNRDHELLDQMRADGVTFGQHGTSHRTRFADPRRRSELGGLSERELEHLLQAGLDNLAAVGVHPRILVPPFNRFDTRQWGVLERRYDVITGGPESVRQLGFHGGPQWRGAAVYLPSYPPLYDTAATILPAVESIIDAQIGTWIPIVLHMAWEVDDEFAALRQLCERIAPYAVHWDTFLEAVDASRPA